MTIHQFSSHRIRDTAAARLSGGESPMPFAPSVELANGRSCIPQHYLRYEQTPDSLAELVHGIDMDTHTPVFAGSDAGGMYLQVGMVGRENYARGEALRPRKLVYGRKWRIDTDTPSSEVIQTAFLAIKKAREHEVRELLTLCDPISGKTSTPFSSHLDLPLMAANPDLVALVEENQERPASLRLESFLESARFGQRRIEVVDVLTRKSGSMVVDLQLGEAPLARRLEGDLPEFEGLAFTIVLARLTQSDLLHEAMQALIAHSDRHVDEHFRYQGFARFSRCNDPMRIAQLSIATRPYARDRDNASFNPVFQQLNYTVDASRAPQLGLGLLAQKNRDLIDAHDQLAGHMPQGYVPASKLQRALA